MTDELTEVGVDGIRRSFDEHYDTMCCVRQDPTGAMWAIQKQHARIEELEAKLEKAVEALALADAALSGANMNMRVVEQKVKATLAELKGQDDE